MAISRKTGDFLAPGIVPRRRERIKRVDLYIVGLGIRGASQVTKETERVLRRCRRVFSAAVFPQMNRYLRTICQDVIDLNFLRRQGEVGFTVYERVVEIVLEGARESPPVAFATYGHPLVYVAASGGQDEDGSIDEGGLAGNAKTEREDRHLHPRAGHSRSIAGDRGDGTGAAALPPRVHRASRP